jgi:hypothetical protein
MNALYKAAAQFVLLLHLLFILVAMFGGFGLLLCSTWIWIHLPILFWAAAVNIFGWTCPLTPLEKKLWQAGGHEKYAGGFILHYFGPLLNLGSASRRMEVLTGVIVLIWNVVVYAGIWLRLG